jgi:hypothetical protein
VLDQQLADDGPADQFVINDQYLHGGKFGVGGSNSNEWDGLVSQRRPCSSCLQPRRAATVANEYTDPPEL